MRHRFARADQHASVLVDYPELRAPAVRRHAAAIRAARRFAVRPRRAGRLAVITVVMFKRTEDLENKTIVIA